MGYSLIIADDEKFARESLAKIVKWDELGFDLIDSYCDGAQVLEHLKDHPVDCLLIDIQMIKVSGLEVAEFIHKNSLPTKVVFLTGHKNFEYARKAVEYKVEHYLVKPLSLREIKRVFSIIRKNLDERTSRERLIEERQDTYNRLINYEKEQFIVEITTFADPRRIDRRLEHVGLSPGELARACIVFSVNIAEDENLRNFLNTYGLQELRELLTKTLRTFDDELDFYALELFGYRMKGLLLENKGGRLKRSESDRERFERSVGRLINMALGLTAQVRFIKYFPSLMDVTGSFFEASDLDEGFKSQFSQQKKLLMTYIIGLEPELALPLFDSIVAQCHALGLGGAINQVILFFSTVIAQLGDEFPILQDTFINRVSVVNAAHMRSEDELTEWGRQMISMLIDLLAKHGYVDNSIQKIRRFIDERFSQDITLSDVAEQVHLHPVYISKIFKEKTGMTFTEYLTDVRIETAARLLQQPGIYVYEVCEKVGYQNIKHFYKVFRRKKGCSPTEYRERIGNENMAAK